MQIDAGDPFPFIHWNLGKEFFSLFSHASERRAWGPRHEERCGVRLLTHGKGVGEGLAGVPKDLGGSGRGSLKVLGVGATPAAFMVTTRGRSSSVSAALWAREDQRCWAPIPTGPQQTTAFGGVDFLSP